MNLSALAQYLPSRLRPTPVRASVRRFEGAAGGRRLANAGGMPAPAASVLAARGRLASRVRYLVSNNPLAASAALGWQTGLVGSGIVAQSAHFIPPDCVHVGDAGDVLDREREHSGVLRPALDPIPVILAQSQAEHVLVQAGVDASDHDVAPSPGTERLECGHAADLQMCCAGSRRRTVVGPAASAPWRAGGLLAIAGPGQRQAGP